MIMQNNALLRTDTSLYIMDPNNKLGNGTYGKVYPGKRLTHQGVTLTATKISSHDLAYRVEYKTLEKLKGNPHIVKILRHFDLPNESSDKQKACIVLEKCIKSLDKTTFSKQEATLRVLTVLNHMAGALSACDDNNIAYNDIKPANILVGRDGNYKLADFGLSTQKDKEQQEGTAWYVAPELLFKAQFKKDEHGVLTIFGRSNHKTDMFSLGATAFELVTGTAYVNLDRAFVAQSDRMLRVDPNPRHAHKIYLECLRHLYNREGYNRQGSPSNLEKLSRDKLNHCIPNSVVKERVIELILALLNIDPNIRPTAKMLREQTEGLFQELKNNTDDVTRERVNVLRSQSAPLKKRPLEDPRQIKSDGVKRVRKPLPKQEIVRPEFKPAVIGRNGKPVENRVNPKPVRQKRALMAKAQKPRPKGGRPTYFDDIKTEAKHKEMKKLAIENQKRAFRGLPPLSYKR